MTYNSYLKTWFFALIIVCGYQLQWSKTVRIHSVGFSSATTTIESRRQEMTTPNIDLARIKQKNIFGGRDQQHFLVHLIIDQCRMTSLKVATLGGLMNPTLRIFIDL